MDDNQNKKNHNKWLSLINIPIQMGIIIFAFACFGSWLDENYPSPKVYYNKVLAIVGVGLAMYNVIRQVNQMNKS